MKTIALRQLRHHWRIYLLLLPAMAFVGLFAYFPAASGVYHAFYRWNGDDVAEYVGVRNFQKALADPVLTKAFGVVMIFIAANLIKMTPSIITAVVIHRLTSERARYLYRVAFVIPMIIPMMVWLLVWKFFYNPTHGVLNAFLAKTGLLGVLRWLDVAMPQLAAFITPVRKAVIDPVFGSVWGLALAGVIVLNLSGGVGKFLRGRLALVLLGPAALVAFGPVRMAGILVSAGLLTSMLRRSRLYGVDRIRWVGGGMIALAAGVVIFSMTWAEPTGAFAGDYPGWLSNPKLIVPSLVFWGFPWVGVVSVLLYLSGLANIDQSTYEAADIDGCGWFRKFTHIELPLITTQVRLNLVLMVIGTLKSWGHVFIILGDGGGPDGAAMLPGLYMFRKAFRDMEAGYACAIGLLLFGLILLLTLINNRYVRVDK